MLQIFAVLATWGFAFLSNFWAKTGLVAPRFKAHIKQEKVDDFIENFTVFNFFFDFFNVLF